jgi:RNA polymerase sigma-70 factor (ECF subfamily)
MVASSDDCGKAPEDVDCDPSRHETEVTLILGVRVQLLSMAQQAQTLDVEELCHRYGPMVMRRCRQLLRNEEEAADVCQDVFVQLLMHRDRLRPEYPSSLLYRIATNLCLNRIRDSARRPLTPGDEFLHSLASLEEPGAGSEARVLLDRLFARHQESSRVIAVLHYVDGLTLQETAQEVGLSVSGVRKRLRGLRETLTRMEGQ